MRRKFLIILLSSIFTFSCLGCNMSKNESSSKKSTQVRSEQSKVATESISTNNYNTKELNWYFAPEVPEDIQSLLKKHNGYYLGDTSKKVIYLTFDEGYENGYTSKILDILKNNNVKAAFFVVVPYINTNKDLVKRMVDEGHLVCNHSNHHPSMAKKALKGKEAFNNEFTDTEKAFKNVTGKEMPKFFRPPMGKYSELSLDYTNKLGYKTIFWSFAYADWDRNKQPSIDFAKKKILNKAHNGAIYLLHAVSKTNTEILDSTIKELKSQGYEFGSLNDLK